MITTDLLFSANFSELQRLLQKNPAVANELIPLPDNSGKAPPLHRVCDGVFNKTYSEDTGIALAKLLLKYGARLNDEKEPGKDSPLTTACSLHCDKIALLYIEHGANIHHPGCHGGTALHWASWTGRNMIVEKLVALKPDINQLCIDFKSTPLFWALHGYKFGGKTNRHNQVRCAEILLQHGADPTIPNFEGYVPKQLIEPGDTGLAELFKDR